MAEAAQHKAPASSTSTVSVASPAQPAIVTALSCYDSPVTGFGDNVNQTASMKILNYY